MRQNREIAKQCSDKSLRIKNLENELARIVAENVRLREDAINARVEAEKWRASHRLNKEVVRMRDQLEEKLGEVNLLVAELGALPEKVARRSSQRRRKDGFVSDLVRDPEERVQRPRPALLDDEGRLPAILEDKQYLRRTLDAIEVQRLADEAAIESLESPDLGPPPVAHLEEHEALAFNATRSPRRTSTELIEESEQISKAENRRKRRVSALLPTPSFDQAQEEEVISAPSDDPAKAPFEKKSAELERSEEAQTVSRPFKAGAKRKLEMSELEDTSKVSKELDDFIFQRRSGAAATTSRPSRLSRPARRQEAEQEKPAEQRSPEKIVEPARRVLAPKSTNSPAKKKVDTLSKPVDERERVLDRRTERRVVSRIRSRPVIAEPQPIEDISDVIELKLPEKDADLPPKTPAVDLDGILSPVSTEPSTRQQPKELAPINSVEDVLNGSIGRGSRRARPQVSYAPPKLNTKLRRPGKEMVGAVEGMTKITDQKQSETKSVELDGEEATARKEHKADTQGGKSEPGSPLIEKSAIPRRRSSSGGDDLSRFVSRLSLYNPPSSSPIASEETAQKAEPLPTGGLVQRRHSTQQLSSQDGHQRTSSTGVLRSRRANLPTPLEAGDMRRHNKASSTTTLPKRNIEETDAGESINVVGALTRRKSLIV